MTGHYVKKCSCGKIIEQCRCFDLNKRVEVVERGCEDCARKEHSPASEEEIGMTCWPEVRKV